MLSDGRKVVDSFLFSEPHEKEILLAKFHAGADGIDEFVAIEGAYTFRGEYKGLYLQNILDTDERFAPFRHKVTVLSCRESMLVGPACEREFFNVEFASRELSRAYILSKYSDRDFVTCTDVDEMLDFSDPRRAKHIDRILLEAAGQNKIAWIAMLKFWYDFDNASRERKFYPLGPISIVKGNWRQRQAPSHIVHVAHQPKWLAFEYSFCFSREAIYRKLCTFSHDGYTMADVDRALAGNHWVKSESLGQKAGDRPEDFFTKQELNKDNSPPYVLENISWLKTHVVGS